MCEEPRISPDGAKALVRFTKTDRTGDWRDLAAARVLVKGWDGV